MFIWCMAPCLQRYLKPSKAMFSLLRRCSRTWPFGGAATGSRKPPKCRRPQPHTSDSCKKTLGPLGDRWWCGKHMLKMTFLVEPWWTKPPRLLGYVGPYNYSYCMLYYILYIYYALIWNCTSTFTFGDLFRLVDVTNQHDSYIWYDCALKPWWWLWQIMANPIMNHVVNPVP